MFILIAAHLYTVHPGDTLSSRFGASWPAVCQVNRLQDCSLIYPGQRLVIVRGTADRGALAYAMAHTPAPVPVVQAHRPTVETTDSEGEASTPASYSPSQVTYNGSPGTYQACVISRESGGDPYAVNPQSGAGGLYGFLPSTWQSLGYSGLPENAPVSVQNQAFQALYSQAGSAPWVSDGCQP